MLQQKTLSFTLVLILGLVFSPSASAQFLATRASSRVNLAPYYIAIADFNQDGKQDMAMAGYSNIGQVGVLLGNGDGTFQKPVYYDVGSYPNSIAVGDFNNDGKLDLAVANLGSVSLGFLFGNGNGTFQPQSEVVLPAAPMSVSAADFNGDQILDLATVNQAGTFSVLIGNGDGTFQAPIFTIPATLPQTFGIGDFDRDGKLDVATAGQDVITSHVDVFLGNGDGTFETGLSYLVGSAPLAMVVGDFRNIGKLDLVTATLFGGDSVLLGNGDGTFQQSRTYSDSGSLAIATGDFNRDGKLDFVTSGDPDQTCIAGAYVFLGNGDGTFQPAVAYRQGIVDTAVAVADFNGDRWPDLAVGDTTSFDIITLLNTGVVSFSPTAPVLFPAQLLNSTSNSKAVTLTNTGKHLSPSIPSQYKEATFASAAAPPAEPASRLGRAARL